MKICQVIDSLHVGGAERVCVNMCNLLEEKKCDFHLLLLVSKGELFNDLNVNVDYTILNRNNKFSIFKLKETSDIIRKFDIIHCHFKYVYKYVKLVSLLFNLHKLKIVLHDHGVIDLTNKNHRFLITLLTPKFYIGVSQIQIDFLDKIKKNRESFLLRNTVTISYSKNELNRKFDLIVVSNIKPLKNQMFAAQLAEKYNLSVLFVGKNQDDKYFENLKYYCDNANISYSILENVNNPQAYLHNAKVGLHISKSETGPLVLLEYMCKSLPFIAYDTGEIAQDIKITYPSLIKDNFDLTTWYDTYKSLRFDNSIGEELKSFFDKNYGKEQYFNNLMNIYNQIYKQ